MTREHGKQYREALKKVDRSRLYDPAEAVKLIKAGAVDEKAISEALSLWERGGT